MDLDVMAKHMPGLIEFKKRVEALLDGAEAGSGTATEALSNQIDALRAALGKVGGDVAALQVLRSGDDRRLSDVSELLDGLAGLKDMAEWFAANRDGLEVLLSIGDDMSAGKPAPDQPQPDPAPAPVAEPVATAEPAAEPQTAAPAPGVAPDPAPADAPQLDPAPQPTSSGDPGA